MKLEDIKTIIVKSNPFMDWQSLHIGSLYHKIYVHDVNLRIELNPETDIINEDFKTDWTQRFFDEKTASYGARVYYNSSCILKSVQVSVDGCRAYIPVLVPTNDVPFKELDYAIPKILCGADANVDHYINIALGKN